MKLIYFTHSIVSDWNNGNAHFLRGVVSELLSRGHEVEVYEPENGWSLTNLRKNYGDSSVNGFYENFPNVVGKFYNFETLNIEEVVNAADVVIVHEWNEQQLVRKIGQIRKKFNSFRVLFHDTHHRAISDPDTIQSMELSNYDGVLAFGESLKNVYHQKNWVQKVWVWHEAADIRIFKPYESTRKKNDLVWIGNWGDDERSSELYEYIFGPVNYLRLKCEIYGVRYPQFAIDNLRKYSIDYRGWVPNYLVPQVFSESKLTVHVPRRPYVEMLPGIPTIRVFEALACGIPLITSQWDDSEKLFTEGKDYIKVSSGTMMKEKIRDLLNDRTYAEELSNHGRETIQCKHTCAHRVDQLLKICNELGCKESDSLSKNVTEVH